MGVNVRKNLIYFIYYSGRINHYHQLNLSLLKKYWSVFDGQIIVKVAVDGKYSLMPLKSLLPNDCQIEVVQNNRVLGESVHFINSIRRIDSGITFYGHCKGVSRPRMKGLDTWITNLYEKNLRHIPKLDSKLFSGICGKLLPCPPFVPQNFHYSGSFYWFNHDEVKKRLKDFEFNKYLTERFPGMIAKQSECIFGFATSSKNENFYDQKTWDIYESMVF